MMKHKFLLLLLLLIGSIAWAENGFLSTIPIVHPLYGQLYDYEPKGVYPLPDGSMYVLGTAGWEDDLQGIPWSYGPVVTLLDPNGNLLWHRYPPWGSECQFIFSGIDSDFSIHYVVNFYGSFYVGKTDLSGITTVGSAHTFQYQRLDLFCSELLPTNEILVGGALHGQALIARLSAIGDTISVARYSLDDDSDLIEPYVIDLKLLADGNIISVCKLSSLKSMTILVTDIGGLLIHRADYTNGDYALAYPYGFIDDSVNGGHEILMLYTTESNQNGKSIFQYVDGIFSMLDNLDYLPWSFVSSAARNGTHRYYLSSTPGDATICETNLNSQITWEWTDDRLWWVPSYNQDCIGFLGDHTIAVGPSPDMHDLYVVKLQPNGCVHNHDEVTESPANNLVVYPNPMKDRITILSKKQSSDTNKLDIYNIRGQIVNTLVCQSPTAVWDGRDNNGTICKNGLYIILNRSTNEKSLISIYK